jgi:hypothetical protein
MAYVCQLPATQRIRLPRRPWNSGMGQMSASASFCAFFGLTSGWCAQFAPPTPPALPAPAAPQTSDEMTIPGAWTPDLSEIQTNQDTVSGAQQFLQNVATPGAVAPCDWTSVTWTDPSTWCAANWAIVGLAAAGLVAVAMNKKGGR